MFGMPAISESSSPDRSDPEPAIFEPAATAKHDLRCVGRNSKRIRKYGKHATLAGPAQRIKHEPAARGSHKQERHGNLNKMRPGRDRAPARQWPAFEARAQLSELQSGPETLGDDDDGGDKPGRTTGTALTYHPVPLSAFITSARHETKGRIQDEYEVLDSHGRVLRGRRILNRRYAGAARRRSPDRLAASLAELSDEEGFVFV